jgi:hypothetical protein
MNLWKRKKSYGGGVREITTLRGQSQIDEAISQGSRLIYRQVEPFPIIIGKYCVLRDKVTGKEFKIYDFRDERGFSDEFEMVKEWTYQYRKNKFPKEAAYVIPDDIEEGEQVHIQDLIENFLGYQHNQGDSERLKSCMAVWKDNDLHILYDPKKDCIMAVG